MRVEKGRMGGYPKHPHSLEKLASIIAEHLSARQLYNPASNLTQRVYVCECVSVSHIRNAIYMFATVLGAPALMHAIPPARRLYCLIHATSMHFGQLSTFSTDAATGWAAKIELDLVPCTPSWATEMSPLREVQLWETSPSTHLHKTGYGFHHQLLHA